MGAPTCSRTLVHSIGITTHLMSGLNSIDLLCDAILVKYAPDDICIGTLARNVTLKHHEGFPEISVEPFVCRVCKEIQRAHVFIGITLSLCYKQRYHRSRFVLTLVPIHNVCPFHVIVMNHVNKIPDLFNRKSAADHSLVYGICPEILRHGVKTAKQRWDNVNLQMKPLCQHCYRLVTIH